MYGSWNIPFFSIIVDRPYARTRQNGFNKIQGISRFHSKIVLNLELNVIMILFGEEIILLGNSVTNVM